MKQIRAFIVEHQPVMRYGLKMLLESSPEIGVVGEADSGEVALRSLAACTADVVLLDLDVDGEDGSSIIRRIADAPPGAKVLVTIPRRGPQRHWEALLAGARGLVTKDQPGEIFLRAIRKVHEGELWFERHVLERTLSRSISRERRHAPPYDALTAREREIITRLGEGLKNGEIASRLHITTKTVRNHLTSIFAKLGVSDRLALLVHASRLGLVSIRGEWRELPHWPAPAARHDPSSTPRSPP
jgi:DNA-binding NarL/FixJ family response regulator